jgi:glycosyltransferase involved in cell wall biosynthesis
MYTKGLISQLMKHKLIRITTVPGSLGGLLRGQLGFMNQYYHVIGISSDGEMMDNLRRNENIDTHIVEMTRSITPLRDLKAAIQLYRFFRKEKPYIVHTHTPKAGTVGLLAAWFARVPHRLHTIAGLPLLEENGVKRILLDNVEKITYNCATQILPNSYELQRIILNLKLTTKDKMKVIGNGSSNGINTNFFDRNLITDTKKEALKKELNISDADFVFIFIGRLVKDKGINELVSAFDNLSQNNSNCKLILVGGREDKLDPLSSETETLIKTNMNILAVGFQRDIRPFVTISKALVFPSYREGFPNVVLQASAMELPCIVSNINGCNEIIENEVNGLIVPVKNKTKLEKAMRILIEFPEKRLEMKRYTRSRIVKRYEQKFVWNELLNFYNNLN